MSFVRAWHVSRNRVSDGGDVVACHRQRHTRLQSSRSPAGNADSAEQDCDPAAGSTASTSARAFARRAGKLELKVSRDDPDDGERLSSESSGATNQRRIGAQPAPPEALTQYHHVRHGTLVLVPKRASGDRRHAQHIEEACGDCLGGNRFRDTVISDEGASSSRRRQLP